MPNFFLQHLWPGLVLWIALYISDYSLTLTCARLYQNGVREKIAYEGSYEITPYFQRDIDSLRRVSPRFIGALLAIAALLSVLWRLVPETGSAPYAFLLGVLISIQLTIHIRHLRNLFTFRAAMTDAVRGRIEYSRPTMLRHSSLELLSFAGLYLVLYVFTFSWFVLGGTVGCLALANGHWRLARKHSAKAQAAEQATADEAAMENSY